MKCEYVNEPCSINLKICTERAELCKRRKLLRKGMTQEQIDDLWNVPEKYRTKNR